jgi:antirestriction protein ArdC
MTRTATPPTEEERDERREQERQLVAQAVAELKSSDGWQRWLATRSRFHRYSFGNQMLIAFQRPTAEHVAVFRKWLELGYCVRKGEHGIRIWAPIPPSKAKVERFEQARKEASSALRTELEGERPRTAFRLVAVFAQDQVEELPPPAVPAPLSVPIADVDGDTLADRLPQLIGFAETIGSAVRFEDLGRASRHGCYMPADKSIVIGTGRSPNQQVKTLIHELGHALVRADKQDSDPTLDYAQEELVVESVAFSVAGVIGLDTSSYSLPYLAAWSEHSDIAVIEQTAKLVNRLANRLEDALSV